MTNNIISFDFNGVKVLKDSNTKLIKLKSPSTSVNTSLHDFKDNTNYQVPAGKKFTIIYIENFTPNGTPILSSTTVVDSATGAVTLRSSNNATTTNEIFISSEVAANLFITITGAGISGTTIIYGIEETA